MKGLSDKPREPKEGDPTSRLVSQMLRVGIPEGVTLNIAEMRNGEAYKEFGVSHMMHGMVSDSSGESVEGTVLYFNGENFRVDVSRRDLTAEEINRIGRLSIDLDARIIVLESLPRQIEKSEELIKNLGISKDVFRDRLKNSSFDPVQVISELGILITKMKSSLGEQREQWRNEISELASLGVTEIRDQNGGLLAGLPVGKMAETFAAEAQEAREKSE